MKLEKIIKIGLTSVVLSASINFSYAKESEILTPSSVIGSSNKSSDSSLEKTFKIVGFIALGASGLAGMGLTYFMLRLASAGKMSVLSTKEQKKHDFIQACREGNLNKVKELLMSKSVNIDHENHLGIRCACCFNQLEVVKYLLTSPDLKKHSNIHIKDDECFKSAYLNNKKDLVKYLIYDYKIKKTSEIEKFIMGNDELTTMFVNRNLNENKSISYKL